MFSYRMLWDFRLISFQQRFISPVWCEPPPLSLLHSVPSSCPSPSTVDWHGTQWHPGHEGRPAAKDAQETKSRNQPNEEDSQIIVFCRAFFLIFVLRLLPDLNIYGYGSPRGSIKQDTLEDSNADHCHTSSHRPNPWTFVLC